MHANEFCKIVNKKAGPEFCWAADKETGLKLSVSGGHLVISAALGTLVYKLAGCLNYDIWFACYANQE